MALEPEVARYLREVAALLYLPPGVKRSVVRSLARRIGEAAAAGGIEAVRAAYGEPRRLAAETMLALAEKGRSPSLWCSGGWGADFEYKSALTLYGQPLLHVAYGYDPETGRPRVARGVIAVGNLAVGGLAVGGLSLGLLSLGGVSFGILFGLGALAFGGFAALGGMALAVNVALGSIAIGRVALGVIAVGKAAAGVLAAGMDTVREGATRAELLAWLLRNVPFAKEIVRLFRL